MFYGDKLSKVVFDDHPNGEWTWDFDYAGGDTVGLVGKNQFRAIFTPYDSSYNESVAIISLEVRKKTLTIGMLSYDSALAALKADNEALQRALASAEANAVENVIRELHHMPGYLVTFDINKSKIQNKDRVNLGKIAEALKDTDDSVILLLTGYADEGTGTVKINERLSRERAEAVYNCLVNEFGVKPEKLETDYKGGVENMFYDDAILSRSVVISIKQ